MPSASVQPSADGPQGNPAQHVDLAPSRWQELGVNPATLAPDVRAAIIALEPGRLGAKVDRNSIDAAQRALAHEALAIEALQLALKHQPPLPKLD